jgi:hypothetical protein
MKEEAVRGIILAVAVLCMCAGPSRAGRQRPPVRGEVVLTADFEGPNALAGWSGSGTLDSGYQNSRALRVEWLPGTSPSSAYSRFALPVERLRGCVIRVSGMVRAENVTDRPQPWNGIKMMLPITHPGGTLYPQAKVGTGTFAWKRIGCIVRVPSDATSAVLHLGLEEVSGQVWFDDVRVVVVRPPAAAAPQRASGPVYRGHSLPRLRGTMISPDITPDSLRTLGQEWNANVIRWQLVRTNEQAAAQPDYDKWLEGELARLDAALPYCRKYGLMVVLDLHSPPGGSASAGGYAAADADMFSDKGCQAKLVEVWQHLARRYRGVEGIWGYDLANEPVEDTLAEGLDDWHGLAERAARAIRAIDPERAIIVECAAGGNPDGFDGMEPLNVPNVIYSVHMYLPHAFTHQGVFGPSLEVRYPSVIDGKCWDRAQLEVALKPVMEFQRKYGVHIYVGEFSAIRWAPDDSAYRYLKDLIEIFEANGWDWTYHAFREWDGWSAEHGSDRADNAVSKTPTSREILLRSWFARNRHPAASGQKAQ